MPFTPVTFTDGITPLNKATFDSLQSGVIAAERTENKAAANGYAPLDATSKVPLANLPSPLAASSTPPAGPVEGSLWFYQPQLGYTWLFRYNASSASAYKWEFVGGMPLWVSAGGSLVSTTSVTYTTIDGTTPAFTVVRPGNYFVEFGAQTYNNVAGKTNYLALHKAGAVMSEAYIASGGMASLYQLHYHNWAITGAASEVVDLRYHVEAASGSTGSWQYRWMKITPMNIG